MDELNPAKHITRDPGLQERVQDYTGSDSDDINDTVLKKVRVEKKEADPGYRARPILQRRRKVPITRQPVKERETLRRLFGQDVDVVSQFVLIDDDVPALAPVGPVSAPAEPAVTGQDSTATTSTNKTSEDSVAENKLRFSRLPLRLMEPMLCTVLGVDINSSGDVFKINRFKKGRKAVHFTVEVEVYSEAHRSKLLSLSSIDAYKVKTSENVRKNCVTGTLKDFRLDFHEETDQFILDYLQEKGVQNLVEVERLGNSNVIKTIFRGQTLPKFIDVKIRKWNINAFVEKPRRCFKCQGYSHTSYRCNREKNICYNCGVEYDEESHDPKNCKIKAHCANCGGGHRAGSGGCKEEQLEMKLCKIMAEKGISRAEAKRRFPDGNVGLFSDICAQPPLLQHGGSSQSRDAARVLQPMSQQSSFLDTIISQNTEILRRLGREENSTGSEAVIATESTEDQGAIQTQLNILMTEMQRLSKKQQESEEQIQALSSKLAEKDEIIKNMETELADKCEVIDDLHAQLAAIEPDIPYRDQLVDVVEANKKLTRDNSKILEANSNLKEEIKELQKKLQDSFKKGPG